MTARTKARVRERADHCCEYCLMSQDDSPLAALHIEHIIPKIHGGSDDLDNLALACIDCNLHKGTNLTGIDPETKEVTPLFNPRSHKWLDHFSLVGAYIAGKSPIGRTTVRVLDMNSEEQLTLRASPRD